MAEAQRVSYYPTTDDLFIAFELDRPTVGITENASAYEVFADDELMQKGITKIVAVEILDMDGFDPEKADEIPSEYRQAVTEAYHQYHPDKRDITRYLLAHRRGDES